MRHMPLSITSEAGLQALQLVARALIAVLAVYYFMNLPAFYFDLPIWSLWVLAAAYASAHIVLLVVARSSGKTSPLGAAVDLLALGCLIAMDPIEPPPTLALLFVAVLSSGILHGLIRFLITLAVSILVLALALGVRQMAAPDPLSAGTLFLLAALTISVLYFTLLLYRNTLLQKHAAEATWQDPETGLISRAALTHTAGWMLPLHDRLSSPLTIALCECNSPELVNTLNDAIAERLRRSDVAARFSENTIAVMLTSTNQETADTVFAALHEKAPGIRVAAVTLSDANVSLEDNLETLQSTLRRANENDGNWLVHAAGV